MIIVNMNNINSNINLTRRQKLITFFESFINILIIFPILCFYLYIKLKSSKLNIDKKNYKLDLSSINTTNNIYNITFRNLNSEQIIDIIKKKHLIDTLTSNIYYGKWFTKSSENKTLVIGESISGLSKADFLTYFYGENSLRFIVENYENNYINHYIQHSSDIIIKNIGMHDDPMNNKFILNGTWETTQLNYKEIFDIKISRNYNCPTNLKFIFQRKNVTYWVKTNEEIFNFTFGTIDNSFFEVELKSLCGFNMSMEFSPLDNNNKYFSKSKEKKQVFIYFILIGIVCLLNLLNNISLIKDLSDNNEFVKCIPTFSLGYNINWHIYCCITHIFFFSFEYKEYYYEFSTLGLAYLINILFYDIRLSCVYWNIIKSQTTNRTYIQKRMIYFSSFYIFIIFSFFVLSELMIYNECIIIIGILAWTPQIIHNFIYYNKYIYSILYIISFTLDKIIFGIYFRANDNNFVRIKGDKNIIIKLNLYILSNLFIIFLQYKFGPRFCFGKLCQKNDSKLYRTKKELIDEIKDVNSMECVICLMPIFDKEKNEINIIPNLNINMNEKKNNKLEFISQSTNSTNEIKINNEFPLAIEKNNMNNNIDIEKNIQLKNKKEKIKINKIKFKDIIKCLAPFYKFSKKPINKPYMKTPCNHIFHKECLEKWILLNKKCPSCRGDLSGKI